MYENVMPSATRGPSTGWSAVAVAAARTARPAGLPDLPGAGHGTVMGHVVHWSPLVSISCDH